MHAISTDTDTDTNTSIDTGSATGSGFDTGSGSELVGRVSTRHVGLKSDLPGANTPETEAQAKPTHEATQRAAYEINKLEKRLCRQVGQAVIDFNMIEEGDRVMVCVSGGKDSFGLLDILLKLQKRAPINFEIIAVNLDQKQPGFPAHILPEYLAKLGIEYHIETQDTYSIVKSKVAEGKTMCSLCSRLRRGILYRVADELKITKIALGHHRDDMLHTFFLNMFFAGKLKGMPPKLVSDDGGHIVIRPLANVAEKDLIRWAEHRQFPIIPCSLCGSQENLQRQEIKRMVNQWERQYPGRTETMFTALQNVVPSHLMDVKRHNFKDIKITGVADADGDKVFDEEEFPLPSVAGLQVVQF